MTLSLGRLAQEWTKDHQKNGLRLATRMIGPGPLANRFIVKVTSLTNNGTKPRKTSYQLTVRKFRPFAHENN